MAYLKLDPLGKGEILIRAANWVGDAIMTTPVIRAMRRNFPNARITVLAKPWVIPVHEHSPFIDAIMIYQNDGRHAKGFGTLRLAKDMRAFHFDLALLMQNAFEAALITFLAGIPERLGYNTDARELLLSRPVKLDPALKKGHLIDYYLGILEGAGLVTDGRSLDLFITEQEKKQARELLAQHGIQPSDCLIGINPGATGGTAKQWFPERFAGVAQGLYETLGTKIIIFGGPGDGPLGDRIINQTGNACINLAGKTSLRLAFALIDTLDLFITNDSGLMHVAAALGISQIALIGSTDHIATAPSNPNSHIIRVPVPCSPCMKPSCRFEHHDCMNRITAEMVLEKSLSMIHGDR